MNNPSPFTDAFLKELKRYAYQAYKDGGFSAAQKIYKEQIGEWLEASDYVGCINPEDCSVTFVKKDLYHSTITEMNKPSDKHMEFLQKVCAEMCKKGGGFATVSEILHMDDELMGYLRESGQKAAIDMKTFKISFIDDQERNTAKEPV